MNTQCWKCFKPLSGDKFIYYDKDNQLCHGFCSLECIKYFYETMEIFINSLDEEI